MNGFYLTPPQLAELRIAHKSECYKRSAYKINAVILLGTGWKLKEVKEALLLDEETLRDYVKRYQSGGIENLISTHYRGSESLLTIGESQTLCAELDNSIYLTTQAIISYVEKEFEITYKTSGMRDLLHRLGYSYIKPKCVPGNPDHESQEIFLKQYEDFMLKKSANVEILFMDAVHPEHNGLAAYGWMRKGKKRLLKTNSGRERLNLHGAMNAETLEVTIIESKTVNADSTIQLLGAIENRYPLSSEIIIILDNARYHYSREVKEFLTKSKIKLAFLPSYSPNLNLIERLWKFFKKKVLYNTYYATLDLFREACINFFRNIDQFHNDLTRLMSQEFELI